MNFKPRWAKSARKAIRLGNFIVLVGSWILFFTGDATAWGPGIHVITGTYVLDHLYLLLPSVAELLKAFPRDFLYGCISADFFIGKGHRRRDDHCHNWSIGLKMLASAEAPPNKSFCYGYLAHLAADIGAHNFYIPNQLYLTSTTKRFGHIYWEYRADSQVDDNYWEVARRVVEAEQADNDFSLENAVKKKIVSLKTKKKVYVRMLNLTDLERWREMCEFIERKSRWKVAPEYLTRLENFSIAIVVEFLRSPDDSICFDYDPVGTRNITRAKRLRRTARRTTGAEPVNGVFEIPVALAKFGVDAIELRPGSYHLRHLEPHLRV